MSRPNPPRPLARQLDIANRLRVMREDADWTRRIVARRATEAGCPMTASTVCKIETQGRAVYVAEAVALAEVFGVNINDLLAVDALD